MFTRYYLFLDWTLIWHFPVFRKDNHTAFPVLMSYVHKALPVSVSDAHTSFPVPISNVLSPKQRHSTRSVTPNCSDFDPVSTAGVAEGSTTAKAGHL